MWEGLQAVRREIEEAVNTAPDNQEINDGFQLRFVGKSYAKFVAGLPSETILVPDTDWNNQDGNRNSQNIFITGDNLDALKHLVNAYTGTIKMIYIDPPYNTGAENDFVYKDSFNFSDGELKQKLGFTDTEVARLRALNGKCSHSAWLTFMLPRLMLAKQLLADDGVIFISIDDNEQANLKCLCDTVIFGEQNFIAQISWRRTDNQSNIGTFARVKEYVLVYARKKDAVKLNKLPLSTKAKAEYRYSDENGYFRRNILLDKVKGRHEYAVTSPGGKILHGPWMIKKEDMEELIQNGKIYWSGGKAGQPYGKTYLADKQEDGQIPNDFWGIEFGTNQRGSLEVESLFNARCFDFPKPVSLIQQLCSIGLNKDGVVLDFFSGSATTAHAVMQLNKEDGGNRKYIMVQWGEPVRKAEVKQLGFNTIDEISRERIKRAAKQIGDTSGFKHYKLASVSDDLVLNKIDNFDPAMPNLLADDMVSPFSGDALGTGLAASGLDTILTTWMVDDGYAINSEIEEYQFGNYVAHSPAGSRCLYLISSGWDSDATRDLLNKIGRNEISVQTVVIYNYSFDFTTLTELKNNLRTVLDDDKKVEIIERF